MRGGGPAHDVLENLMLSLTYRIDVICIWGTAQLSGGLGSAKPLLG